MFSQISASLSHTPSSLTTTVFSFRPSLTTKFRLHPFNSPKRRRFSAAASMDGASTPSPPASVDSISEDLKNQRLENTNFVVEGVRNATNSDNIAQNRVKLKLEELKWDHSFVRELPGDPRSDSIPREEMRGSRSIEIWKMGAVNYFEALKMQEKLTSDRKIHKIKDTLLSLQHPHTYTLGKRRTVHNVLVSEAELKAMGAELHYTERGGDVTYHGPHQAILYPIVSLRDIGLGARKYVENLESTMIELASLYGVKASAGERGETGVWVGKRKIGAIGVRISSGITSHGLAFNINPDMNYFKHIVPCGIADKEVTSLQREVGEVLPSEEVIHDQLISCFVKIFGYTDITWRDKSSISLDDKE